MKTLELVKISGIVSGVGFTETFADGSGSYSEKICDTLFDTGNDNKDAAESKKWGNIIVTAVNNTYHKGINPEAVPEMMANLKEFLQIINRTPAALHHYGELINKVEQTIQKATL